MTPHLWVTLAWGFPGATPDWTLQGGAGDQLGRDAWMLDADGDGFSDLVLGYGGAGYVRLFAGSAAGPSAVPGWELYYPCCNAVPRDFGSGDFDGDGFDDLVLRTFDSSFGAAVYPGSATSLADTPTWTHPDFAVPSASVGDVNGDGFDDLLATPSGGPTELYAGSADGLAATPGWSSEGACTGVGLDADGDGYGDVAVSCGEGELQLFSGGPGGLATEPAWVEPVNSTILSLGAADFDGDGFDDLVVGDSRFDGYLGRVWLHPGSAAGLLPSTWGVTGSGQVSGLSVCSAGDLDGDADPDLVVCGSTPNYATWVGVFAGDPAGLGTAPAWSFTDVPNTSFGAGVTARGDVNGDGLDDLLLWSEYVGGSSGIVHLFYGAFEDDDGDGATADVDCDDQDSEVFPGALEVDGDGADQDCDGRDAALGVADLALGALRITEVMRMPAQVGAAVGQWLEVEVAAEAAVDLIGLKLEWEGGEAVVEGFLVVSPGDRLVVGATADAAINGGVEVDLALEGLALGDGTVSLSAGGPLDEVALGELPSTPGAAAQLVDGAWCLATTPYGDGDLGTPGAPNGPCPEHDAEEPVETDPTPGGIGVPEEKPGCGCRGSPVAPGLALAGLAGLLARRRPRGLSFGHRALRGPATG